MEYLDDCSTTIRHVARKAGLYVLEVTSSWGCSFQTSGLAYDILADSPAFVFLCKTAKSCQIDLEC